MHVQALIAEAAAKRFDVRIIRGFARSREIQRDVLVGGPEVEYIINIYN